MVRKITSIEFDAVKQLREDTGKFVTDIFPKANVDLNIVRFGGRVGLSARIIGDTAPHPLDVIVECLGDLGVQQISIVDPSTHSVTQVPIGRNLEV